MHDLRPPRPTSSAGIWRPLVRFVAVEARLGQWPRQWPTTAFLYEFCRFVVKQAWACLFGAAMVGLLIATHLLYPRGAPLSRYDFLFLTAIAIQAAMLAFRLETVEEAKVILLFHAVGTLMEIFKTATGSWIYPESNLFRIAGVPLFSGFMYASIGSYIARAWRLFDFASRGIRRCGSCSCSALASMRISSPTITAWIFAIAAAVLLFGRTGSIT